MAIPARAAYRSGVQRMTIDTMTGDVMPASGGGAAWARVLSFNPLSADGAEAALIDQARAVGRVIAWSGSLAEDLSVRDPRTWLPEGLSALDKLCRHIEVATLPTDCRILLRPHARHVLCDAVRCRTFMQDRSSGPIGLALDPAALLEPEMTAQAADHLTRIFEMLGQFAEAVLLPTGAGRQEPILQAQAIDAVRSNLQLIRTLAGSYCRAEAIEIEF